ncbi:MAG TPA: sulfate ABC transporter substrate-binding protein [Pyrinomonadaceae bacterium]
MSHRNAFAKLNLFSAQALNAEFAQRVNRLVVVAAIVLTGVASCTNSKPSTNKVILTLAAYTAPREAYGTGIIPAFQQYWKDKTGQDVEVRESYQGSGAQARAIISGFEADVAALSMETDIDKIAAAGLITHNWRARPSGGMVSNSIVVIAVREGNPKQIHDWADLTRPGLNILTPDPQTSGGAQWNINAIYGAALRGCAGVARDDPNAATQFLRDVFRNVSVMDKGARESITNFEKGVGDVAITYESEVLVGRQEGQRYDYIVPRSTILIENPVAVVDAYADKHGVRQIADAFVNFLWNEEAQRAFAHYGFRSLDQRLAEKLKSSYPSVQDLWTIEFLGGWNEVTKDIYGPQGVYTRMFAELHQK